MIVAQEKHFIKAKVEFETMLHGMDQATDEGLRIEEE